MNLVFKTVLRIAICLVPFVCSSCLSLSVPTSAKVEPPPPRTETPTPLETKPAIDKALVDTWELLYLVNEKGEQERPRASTRTLIEFTDNGQVIFNRMDRDRSEEMKSRTGKYTAESDRMKITDGVYNTVWRYQLAGDTLIISIPEENKKFYWRRFR